VTASENSQEQQLPEKEEFLTPSETHLPGSRIDFVFVDVVREPEIINLISFQQKTKTKKHGICEIR